MKFGTLVFCECGRLHKKPACKIASRQQIMKELNEARREYAALAEQIGRDIEKVRARFNGVWKTLNDSL